jgi:ribosomal protein L17
VTSLFLYEAIRTTRKRAKVIIPLVDRLIAMSKKSVPHIAIRSLNQVVTDKNASRKVMEVLVKRYANRPSGFTTIKIAGSRKGDGAELVDLTLIDAELRKVEEKKSVKAEKKTASKKKTEKKTSESSVSSESSSSSVS